MQPNQTGKFFTWNIQDL